MNYTRNSGKVPRGNLEEFQDLDDIKVHTGVFNAKIGFDN